LPCRAKRLASFATVVVFPDPLQPNHHDDRGWDRSPLDSGGSSPTQKGHQFAMNDFDDLLAWRNGLENRIPESFFLDPLQELPGHLVVHIGFKKNPAYFPQSFPDHGLREEATLPEFGENAVQLLAQIVEHGSRATRSVYRFFGTSTA